MAEVRVIVEFKSNHPIVYLIGILIFLALGIVLAGLGFANVAGGLALGVTGVVIAVVAIILLIDFIVMKRKQKRNQN